MLNVSYIQTKATNFIAKNLAETIDMQVKVERVSFSLWNKIVLKNVQILDTENQTIVESENFFLLIHSVSYSKKQLHFEKLILANTNIHIEKNMQGVWNIQSLFSSKETYTPWDIAIFSIEILNSTFSLLDKQTYEKNDFGINYSDIEITDFSIVASNLHFFESTIMADIQGLSGKEKSGFILKTLSTELRVDSTQMNFKNVQLHTPFSHIITQELNFAYNSFQDFSEFIHAVKIQSTFQHSKLQLADISYFAPTLQLSPYAFQFSGNFTGRIADFKTKNLHIEYGEKSQFYGDIEMMGLPTISETFIHVHTKRFSTNSTDIVNIRIPPYTENKYIKVPQILHDINEFSYTGNITGFVKDMVAYGTFTTPAGVIHSDVSIKESAFKPNELVFSGDVSFSQFDLQKIAKGTHNWGKTSLVVKVKGDMANGKFNKAFVRGDMANIEFKGYNYKNVSIDGLVSNKRFDGQLEILDTNVTVNFSGMLDYSLEVPEFNFHANLAHANLHALGFVDDSISNISMDTHVDFIGLSLDNLKGEIIINSGVFENSHGTYKSQQFTIDVDNVGEHRNIQINSDLFDVTVAGKGSYQELQDYIYDFLHAHIPSIPKRKNYAPHTHLPHFNLSVHIKKADSLLHIFNPNIHIAQGSYMNSVFSEEQQLCMMESFVPELSIGNVKLQNIKITAEGSTEQINTNLIYSLALNQLTIPDISSSFMFKNNSFEHATHWNHVDSVVYKGSIENSGIFEPSTHAFLPKIVVSVPHQTVVIADSVWHIHIAESTIDSSSIYVSHAYVQKHDEKIEFQGKISHNKNDTISIMFQDFDAENFNNIMPENINFSGVLQGKINFQRLYETPLIFANISSDDFYFNGNKQGVLKIRSMWMPQKRGIKLSISCTKGTTDILSLRGTFDPTSKDMNFTLGLKNYLLSDFSEIFKNTVDNMAGYIDADVSLQGNIQNPTLTGKAEVKRGKFRVIATQTPYNIKGTLNTEGSQFVLSDIALTDTLGNSAHTSGYIDIKNIKNPQYLIALETKKLFALNTN
ncbi:MAG: hypothetical protein GX277_07055, partial [Bacteroidales bacterium]|nr:hypothetical protein [Bacteroidales bacterium]